ncbi:hypothetical protein, partial [Mariniflexile fucanivorans]|uniref:hypothetical protein n=1 Tax=Mariniflexile fucanivorans TaxID=264023 RepID=UPI00339D4AFB
MRDKKKHRRFAAAKKGSALGSGVHKQVWDIRIYGLKKTFKKKYQNYCVTKKRVLYLHPLSKETSWDKKET